MAAAQSDSGLHRAAHRFPEANRHQLPNLSGSRAGHRLLAQARRGGLGRSSLPAIGIDPETDHPYPHEPDGRLRGRCHIGFLDCQMGGSFARGHRILGGQIGHDPYRDRSDRNLGRHPGIDRSDCDLRRALRGSRRFQSADLDSCGQPDGARPFDGNGFPRGRHGHRHEPKPKIRCLRQPRPDDERHPDRLADPADTGMDRGHLTNTEETPCMPYPD